MISGLLKGVAKAARPHLHYFTTQGLVNLLWAFGVLRYFPEGEFLLEGKQTAACGPPKEYPQGF